MIANSRYLYASLFSFCVHASIFLYLYGSFDRNTSQTILISQPLQVELKFESDVKILNKKIITTANQTLPLKQQIEMSELITPNTDDLSLPLIPDSTLYSNFSDLLKEEVAVELTKEDQEIYMYAQKIIQTLESAWMKPKNIPDGLVANLRLNIKPSGRISNANLIKSSGNIRFDNSALRAVRRVEAFHFFHSIPLELYEKEFKKIAISFNPS